MIEYIEHIISKIHLPHLNLLLLVGVALFGGIMGGRLFQKFKIPPGGGLYAAYIHTLLCARRDEVGVEEYHSDEIAAQ